MAVKVKYHFRLASALFIAMTILFTGCSEQTAPTPGSKQTASTAYKKPSNNTEAKRYLLGEAVSVGGLSITVTRIMKATALGDEFYNETASGIFLLVDVTVANADRESRTISSDSFRLIDSKGRSFDVSDDASIALEMSGDRGGFFLEQINPGLSKSSIIPFDIPVDSLDNPLTLQVRAGRSISQQTVSIALNYK